MGICRYHADASLVGDWSTATASMDTDTAPNCLVRQAPTLVSHGDEGIDRETGRNQKGNLNSSDESLVPQKLEISLQPLKVKVNFNATIPRLGYQ